MADLGQLEAELAPVVSDHGMEIVDLELATDRGTRVLRLFVDWPEGGVTVEDCAKVSRDCSALLDGEDLVEGRYRLEVSSPGIERRLRKPEHFERVVGQRAQVVLGEPAGEHSRRVTGTVRGVRQGAVELETPDGNTVAVPLGAIRRAKLKVF